jgi:hypothetical protein
MEGLGRLFQGPVKLFAYPTVPAEAAELETAAEIAIEPKLQHLYAYLLENGRIEPVSRFSIDQLHLSPADVLSKLQSGDTGWVNYVPPAAAALIRRDRLFGLPWDAEPS